MITIKTVDKETGRAQLKIEEGTPYSTMILGCEMIIEALIKDGFITDLDDFIEDLKRLYERDLVK